ncbi:MAG: translocation/assembly module TamB domain-containing protein, partial [Acidobacteriaceae bacterium]|nr:translocation/assembly module TamB domain-containing protein [Acidobacteriaceae bacterium]
MNRKSRLLLMGAAAACCLVVVIGLSTFFALQTNWFKNKVRERVIAAVEKASGGRVEIGAFNYSARGLTAEFRNFMIHGSEPQGSTPLFQAKSVRIRLKIVSILKRNVDIASLVVEHPEISLLRGSDAITNIPPLKVRQTASKTGAQLLDLKVGHLEFNHGSMNAEMRRLPLNLHAGDVFLQLTYDAAESGYEAHVSSREVKLDSETFGPFPVSLDAIAALQRDRLIIRQLAITSNESNVRASGMIQPLNRPIVDLNLSGQLDASSIARLTNLVELRAGNLILSGAAHYDEFTAWTFDGKVSGRDLRYQSNSLVFKKASFESEVVVNREALAFEHLEIAAPEGKLLGQGVWKGFRELQVDGELSRLDFRNAAMLAFHRPLAWSGMASGPMHLLASRTGRTFDFRVQTNLQITPARKGIPVSGNIDVSYSKRDDVLQFGRSHLELPATQLSFSGVVGSNLQIAIESTNLGDLQPLLAFSTVRLTLPVLLQNGRAHFDGTITGGLAIPRVRGNLGLSQFRIAGQTWNQARSHIDVSTRAVNFASLVVDQGSLHVSGDAHLELNNGSWGTLSPLRLIAEFRGADLTAIISRNSTLRLPILGGVASGSVDLSGSLDEPRGNARLRIDNAHAYGERIRHVEATATFGPDQLRLTHGVMQAGAAHLSFSGTYNHSPGSWRDGEVRLTADSNGFPLASLAPVREYNPGLNAQVGIHAEGAARIKAGQIEPGVTNGTLELRNVTVSGVPYGSIKLDAKTHGESLKTTFTGDLRESHLAGSAELQLTPGSPVKGEFHLDRIQFETLYALLNPGQAKTPPFTGFVQGGFTFEGPLQSPDQLRAHVTLQEVQLSSTLPTQPGAQIRPSDVVLRNAEPVVVDISNGAATIRSFRIAGKDTNLSVAGLIPALRQTPMRLSVKGAVDLRIFQLFDPNVQSSGQSLLAASIGGTYSNPSVDGTLELRNGSFFFSNFSNGLSAVNGTVKFNRDRATIQKLTARSGGGEISLSGFASFAPGEPVVYRLQANAESVRVRYGGGISATASSELRLTGTSENGLLSGTVTVSRVVLNPNADIGNVLASLGAPAASPANENDFLTGLQLDVRVESAPNLQLSTALSRDVEAEIDLHLRGTPTHPVLLG